MIAHILWFALVEAVTAVAVSPFLLYVRAKYLRENQAAQLQADVLKELETRAESTPAELRTPFGLELLSNEERESVILPEHDLKPWLGERKLSTLQTNEAEILAGAFSSKSTNANIALVMSGFIAILISPWPGKEIVASLLHPGGKDHPLWLYFTALTCQGALILVPYRMKENADKFKALAELCWRRAEAAKKTES